MEKSKQFNSPVVSLYASNRYVVVLTGLETIREALVKKGHDFADRSSSYIEDTYINPKHLGIVTCPYTEKLIEKRRRSLVILKDLGYGRRFAEERINAELDRLIDEIRQQKSRAFDPKELLHRCTNGVIVGFIVGRHVNYITEELPRVVKRGLELFLVAESGQLNMFPILRFLPNYRDVIAEYPKVTRKLFELLNNEIDECVKNDIDCFATSYIKRTSNRDEDREDLLFLMRDLIFGGSETSATVLAWAICLLANNIHQQERMQKQIDDLCGPPGNCRRVCLKDEPSLPYVSASILEIMRIRTVGPLSLPRLTICDTELYGMFIPKNTMVFPNLFSVAMDPDVWPTPNSFQPERFLNENGQVTGKNAIIPFSLGIRVCLGELLARQELFLIVSRLVQLFDIRPPEGQTKITVGQILRMALKPTSFHVRLIPRN
jgi:cytochrome P450